MITLYADFFPLEWGKGLFNFCCNKLRCGSIETEIKNVSFTAVVEKLTHGIKGEDISVSTSSCIQLIKSLITNI